MKCPACKSCLRTVRIDYDAVTSIIYWYCPLEERAYIFGKLTEEKDVEKLGKIKIKYGELYGKVL